MQIIILFCSIVVVIFFALQTSFNVSYNFVTDIPSQKSWGRKKASFYDADMVEEYAGDQL